MAIILGKTTDNDRPITPKTHIIGKQVFFQDEEGCWRRCDTREKVDVTIVTW